MSAPTEQQVPSVWDAYDAWLRRATTIIAESADALNAMNVFPISDADTGSNLKLTLAGIAQAVPDVTRGSLDAIVQAAILSAHGNSGAVNSPPTGRTGAAAGANGRAAGPPSTSTSTSISSTYA